MKKDDDFFLELSDLAWWIPRASAWGIIIAVLVTVVVITLFIRGDVMKEHKHQWYSLTHEQQKMYPHVEAERVKKLEFCSCGEQRLSPVWQKIDRKPQTMESAQ